MDTSLEDILENKYTIMKDTLDFMLGITSQITKAETQNDVFENISEIISNIDNFYAGLFRKENDEIYLYKPESYIMKTKAESLRNYELRLKISDSKTYSELFKTGETLIVNSLNFLDEIFPENIKAIVDKILNFDYNSDTAIIPIKTPEETIGVISLEIPFKEFTDYAKKLSKTIEGTLKRIYVTNKLRESETSFRDLTENIPNSIYIHDIGDGDLIYANAHALKAHGCNSLDELIDIGVYNEPPYSEKEAYEKIKLAEKEGTAKFKWKNRRKDGTEFIEKVTLAKIKMNGNYRIVSIAYDITEQTTIVKNMNNGFALHEIICDNEGKPIDYMFLNVNPAFEKLTGLKEAELIGKTVKELMPETEDYWIEKYGKSALSGQPVTFENYSSSLNKWFSTSAYSPKKGQFVTIFEDITEWKIEEERNKILYNARKIKDESGLTAMLEYISSEGINLEL